MGLAVAQSLSTQDWDIHLLDLNHTTGSAAAASLSATFHQLDITSYSNLASVFKTVFQTKRRIDFVFANAGIAEKANFYVQNSEFGDEAPPEPNLLCVNICLNSVITTSYLALHYFRLSPKEADKSLVMTGLSTPPT